MSEKSKNFFLLNCYFLQVNKILLRSMAVLPCMVKAGSLERQCGTEFYEQFFSPFVEVRRMRESN